MQITVLGAGNKNQDMILAFKEFLFIEFHLQAPKLPLLLFWL